jgi:UDP-N-acetylmuramoyl-L-alanyl-D-glutamate--2,6-diaminopimelate ligase
MGEAAGAGADIVVVTSDNPRREDPQAIADAILPGLRGHAGGTIMELDRRAAIRASLAAAGAGDVVVIAGKGAEAGQTVGETTLPFDDRLVVREELEGLG